MSDVGFIASPLRDLAIVQNAGLGAFAVWRFGQGFQAENERPASFALIFLILPIVLHRSTLECLISTNKLSGLALFAAKLSKEREQLLAVHERMLLLRELTLESIAVGVSGRLLSIDYLNGTVRANAIEPKAKKLVLPELIKHIGPGAEKLGHWFSKLGIGQVANLLRVDF